MANFGELHYYLGLEVKQTSTKTMVRQSAYAMKILKAVALAGCNASHTLMEQ
jgi:hypothetical protein